MIANMQNPIFYHALHVCLLDLNTYVRVSIINCNQWIQIMNNKIRKLKYFFSACEVNIFVLFDVQNYHIGIIDSIWIKTIVAQSL